MKSAGVLDAGCSTTIPSGRLDSWIESTPLRLGNGDAGLGDRTTLDAAGQTRVGQPAVSIDDERAWRHASCVEHRLETRQTHEGPAFDDDERDITTGSREQRLRRDVARARDDDEVGGASDIQPARMM